MVGKLAVITEKAVLVKLAPTEKFLRLVPVCGQNEVLDLLNTACFAVISAFSFRVRVFPFPEGTSR